MYKINDLVRDYFVVVNDDQILIEGLLQNDFTIELYDPTGVDRTDIIININELKSGRYYVEFIPDIPGNWHIVIYNQLYFPWGKDNDIYINNYKLNDLYDIIIRSIGLMQENYYLDQMIYNDNKRLINGRIRIYDSPSSVGTDNGIVASYFIESTYNTDNTLETYNVKRIL